MPFGIKTGNNYHFFSQKFGELIKASYLCRVGSTKSKCTEKQPMRIYKISTNLLIFIML